MDGKSGILVLAMLLPMVGVADQNDQRGRERVFRMELKPVNEVPALSSRARGEFRARIDEFNQIITYELRYQDLEGNALQGHIHIGQSGVNGGISVFLCGNAPTVPAATVPQPPACPQSGTVTGTITPANIIGPAAQGVAPTSIDTNEFEELVRAIRDGVTYVNVHSSKFPGGEVRGQVEPRDDDRGPRGRDDHRDH